MAFLRDHLPKFLRVHGPNKAILYMLCTCLTGRRTRGRGRHVYAAGPQRRRRFAPMDSRRQRRGRRIARGGWHNPRMPRRSGWRGRGSAGGCWHGRGIGRGGWHGRGFWHRTGRGAGGGWHLFWHGGSRGGPRIGRGGWLGRHEWHGHRGLSRDGDTKRGAPEVVPKTNHASGDQPAWREWDGEHAARH